jgi:hypothetical protein
MKSFIILAFLTSQTLCFASPENLKYYLKFTKIEDYDVKVESCASLPMDEECVHLITMRDYNSEDFYPTFRAIAVPAVAAFDGVLMAIAISFIPVSTASGLIIMGSGFYFGISNIQYLNPKFQWKKSQLEFELQDMKLNEKGDFQLVFYKNQYDLEYAEDIILSF